MKRKNMLIAVSTLMIILFTGMLVAQPFGQDRKARMGVRGNHHERLAKMLDLNESQQSQIQEMRLSMQKEMIPLRSEVEKYQGELKLVMTAENFDAGKAESLVNKISDLRAKMKLKHLMQQQAVRNLLTDEQRKKFDLHILSNDRPGKGHRGKAGHRKGRFGNRGFQGETEEG